MKTPDPHHCGCTELSCYGEHGDGRGNACREITRPGERCTECAKYALRPLLTCPCGWAMKRRKDGMPPSLRLQESRLYWHGRTAHPNPTAEQRGRADFGEHRRKLRDAHRIARGNT